MSACHARAGCTNGGWLARVAMRGLRPDRHAGKRCPGL